MTRHIDQIIEKFASAWPDVQIEQLTVSHPADDDGIWFFQSPHSAHQAQLESPDGMCPFTVESDADAAVRTAKSVNEAVEALRDLLNLSD